MIGIGVRLYGADARRTSFGKLAGAAMLRIDEIDSAVMTRDSPSLTVVFHLPGEFGAPTWEHGRLGPYSSKEKTLQIDVAVPSNALESSDALRELILGLRGANALAFEYFKRKGEHFDLRGAEALVTALEERLRPA